MTTTHRQVRTILLLAFTIALVGCGGGAGIHRTPPPPAKPAINPDQAKLTNRSISTILTKSARQSRLHGSPGATTTLDIETSSDRACWRIALPAGIPGPQFAYVQRGHSDTIGPIVIALGRTYRATGCTAPVAPALLDRIEAHPSSFYLNIIDHDHPLGAARGQL
jgi:hypothetical protein